MTGALRRRLAGALYTAVMVLVAAVAAWPIYRATPFILLVAVCAALAAGIALAADLRRWSGWAVAGLLALGALLVGVPLAVPSRLAGAPELLRGLGDLGAGLVLGWKDLVSVDLPVGSYRNLLVPALVVFLVGPCATLLLSWRRGRRAAAAVPVALAMVAFGLLFGSATPSPAIRIGTLTVAAPIETATGVIALLASVLWLSWRSRDDRRGALRRAADSSGIPLRPTAERAATRRAALGAAMVALAAVVVAAVVPAAASSLPREVLRTAAGPEIALARAVSPLAAYRAQFADDRIDDVVLTVTGDAPDRIRLATLDAYDGEQYRTNPDARFARAPSAVAAPSSGGAGDTTFEIGDLDGIWMPAAGELTGVAFAGSRAAALADGFYYSADLSAAVQTHPWRGGDRYRLRAAAAPVVPELTAIAPPGGVSTEAPLPAAMRAWIDANATGTGGAELAGLVRILRERGYLSHGLDGAATRWRDELRDYAFVPSAAGHSLGRIAELFDAFGDADGPDAAGAASDSPVAAVGDDEQFAVAVALLAQDLGFPARVVVGMRLASSDPTLPVCEDGVCRAGDTAAWVEVRAATGEWVPVDVTPQHAQAPVREVVPQADPEVATEVRPDRVEEVVPPRPAQREQTRREPSPDAVDLEPLWAALRIAGIAAVALAIPLAPPLLIVAAKTLRRRGRRRGPPAARIAGGWDEYVDAAVDAGHDRPGPRTRGEAAARYGTAAAAQLAADADRAAFSGEPVTTAEADAYWRVVDTERRFWTARLRRRVRAAVSLRSLVRVDTAGGADRSTRRGSRPARRGPS